MYTYVRAATYTAQKQGYLPTFLVQSVCIFILKQHNVTMFETHLLRNELTDLALSWSWEGFWQKIPDQGSIFCGKQDKLIFAELYCIQFCLFLIANETIHVVLYLEF